MAAMIAPCSMLCSSRASASSSGPGAGGIGSGQYSGFVRQARVDAIAVERGIGAGCDGGSRLGRRVARRSAHSQPVCPVVLVGGDCEQFDVRPIEHHRQGAHRSSMSPPISVSRCSFGMVSASGHVIDRPMRSQSRHHASEIRLDPSLSSSGAMTRFPNCCHGS